MHRLSAAIGAQNTGNRWHPSARHVASWMLISACERCMYKTSQADPAHHVGRGQASYFWLGAIPKGGELGQPHQLDGLWERLVGFGAEPGRYKVFLHSRVARWLLPPGTCWRPRSGGYACSPAPPPKKNRHLGLGLWLVVEAACHPLVSPMRCISHVLKADSGR